jgi:hypothetical protein
MISLKDFICENLIVEAAPEVNNIKAFLKANYKGIASKAKISKTPDADGKYVVNVKGDVVVSNKNLDNLTNGTFKFGVVEGKFDCESCNITTLEGSPREVDTFNCRACRKLTSLAGAPEIVNDFYCGLCSLTSLAGAPKEAAIFDCRECTNLTNLEGSPEKVGRFICMNCDSLVNLKGAPKEADAFTCSHCVKLANLAGAPQKVDTFNCSNCNKLSSLKGSPKHITGELICMNCGGLSSIDGVGKVSGGIRGRLNGNGELLDSLYNRNK